MMENSQCVIMLGKQISKAILHKIPSVQVAIRGVTVNSKIIFFRL